MSFADCFDVTAVVLPNCTHYARELKLYLRHLTYGRCRMEFNDIEFRPASACMFPQSACRVTEEL